MRWEVVDENKSFDPEQLIVQLAGCSIAALGWIGPNALAQRGDYGWSPAYQDVLELRRKYDELRRRTGETA